MRDWLRGAGMWVVRPMVLCGAISTH
jgi:hypothetical protein